MKAEPRFDLDLKYGQQAEARLRTFFDWFANGDRRVEVKRKRYLDLWVYVETYADKGRTGLYAPSGINTTTAAVWSFFIEATDICILVPTPLLRAMLDDPSTRDRSEDDGSCPTRGRLVNLVCLLDRLKKTRATDPASITQKDIPWAERF